MRISTRQHGLTPDKPSDSLPLLEQYERDGYVIARNALDPGLVEEIRGHIFWLAKKHPELRPEELGHLLVKDEPFFLRVVMDERLLDLAELFIGPDIALFATGYLCKPPKTGQPVLWHQDGSYWPLDPVRVVSLWVAVSESNPANGCMRVIPGTHRLPLQPRLVRDDVVSVLGHSMDCNLVDESRAVDLVMQPGDVSIHHPNLIHGSEPNRGDAWRLTQLIRYIPTSTRITQPNWPCAFALRGKVVEGVNDYLPVPRYVAGQHTPFRGCEDFT